MKSVASQLHESQLPGSVACYPEKCRCAPDVSWGYLGSCVRSRLGVSRSPRFGDLRIEEAADPCAHYVSIFDNASKAP